MSIHPEDYELCEEVGWARVEGTRGDLHHILSDDRGGSCKSLCGQHLRTQDLRGTPREDAYPTARACPKCVTAHKKAASANV